MHDQSGRITLHRVPRRYLVAFLSALALLLLSIFDLTDRLGGDEQIEMYVERGLEGVLVLASYLGWAGLAAAIKDPARSVID